MEKLLKPRAHKKALQTFQQQQLLNGYDICHMFQWMGLKMFGGNTKSKKEKNNKLKTAAALSVWWHWGCCIAAQSLAIVCGACQVHYWVYSLISLRTRAKSFIFSAFKRNMHLKCTSNPPPGPPGQPGPPGKALNVLTWRTGGCSPRTARAPLTRWLK